jgi:pantoate--beta-alanine ligase
VRLVGRPGALRRLSDSWRKKGLTVGLVPTMGALHEGHASLIRRAAKECDRVVVSIFVNPKQFGPKEDFSRYPRTFAADKKLCANSGADAIYHPSVEAMYPAGFATKVSVSGVTGSLEGERRPGHFDGVATVVCKLIAAARADKAYFGEKDFQQLAVVRRMVQDLDLGCAIVGCAIVRAPDGLALSSRNVYLNSSERAIAPSNYRILKGTARSLATGRRPASIKSLAAARKALQRIPAASLDYFSLVDSETFAGPTAKSRKKRLLVAIKIGKTRLIDNIDVSC